MINKGINQIRPKGENSFSILFAGDFCVRSEKTMELLRNGGADKIVKSLKPVFADSDIRVMQWETVCGMEGEPIPKSGPNLHNPEFCMDFAKALGIDITLLANNHTGDFGPEMAVKTKERLAEAGFKTVGVGKNLAEAAEPLYIEAADLKIAILNFCENEFGAAQADKAGTNPYGVLDIHQSICDAKNKADLVFLTMHGGHEQNPLPSPRMTKEFRYYAESGADLVYNCHTHCPEGVEVAGGVPIIYSPGNFFFPKSELFGNSVESDTVWRTGYLSKFYCDESGVWAYELIPYRFTQEEIVLLTESAEDKFFDHINKISAPIKNAEELQRYFDGWCWRSGINSYLGVVQRGLPELTAENRNSYLPVRNLFSCESHNDLLKNSLRIIEDNRCEEVSQIAAELSDFMKMDF